jgi:hypothetical protein
MTVKQIFDEIRMYFPDTPEQQMYSLINETYAMFARETRLMASEVEVALVAGTYSYEIPATVNAVKKVYLTNATYDPVTISGASYAIEDWHIKLFDEERVPLVSFDTATLLIIKCSYSPVDLAAPTDYPLFKGEFHRVLVWGAVETLSGINGKGDLMKLANMKVAQYVLGGKKYGNTAAMDIRQDYIPPLYADDIDDTEYPTLNTNG